MEIKKILLITHCHKDFGGWYRVDRIRKGIQAQYPSIYVKELHSKGYSKNLIKRVATGLYNSLMLVIGRYDVIHIFECMHPECMIPAFFGTVLRQNIVLDRADYWGNGAFMTLLDRLSYMFPKITVCSEWLKARYPGKKTLKVINGVDLEEFGLKDRKEARKELNIPPDAKLILALGNTFEGERRVLLKKTFLWVSLFEPEIKLVHKHGLDKEGMSLWLAACDLCLFPTGGEDNELACFPMRVGTYLNAERVIATDMADTEWHRALEPFKCLLQGEDPKDLAKQIIKFFQDPDFRHKLEVNTVNAKYGLDGNKQIPALLEFYGQ